MTLTAHHDAARARLRAPLTFASLAEAATAPPLAQLAACALVAATQPVPPAVPLPPMAGGRGHHPEGTDGRATQQPRLGLPRCPRHLRTVLRGLLAAVAVPHLNGPAR